MKLVQAFQTLLLKMGHQELLFLHSQSCPTCHFVLDAGPAAFLLQGACSTLGAVMWGVAPVEGILDPDDLP